MSTDAVIRRATAVMDTFLQIEIAGGDAAALHRAADRAFRLAHRLAAQLSCHDPSSEVSRLNAEGHCRAASARLRRIVAAALRVRRDSGGAFDPVPGSAPSGPPLVRIEGRRVRLARPGARLDLGAIAKGFVVDEIVRLLRRRGVRAGLVNAGGDMRAFGRRAWGVELRHPLAPGRIAGRVQLRDSALCVSAGTFRHRHLRDPRTGRPARGRAAAAAVVAATAMDADAWATALFVGGRGILDAWPRARGRGALLLERARGRLRALWTPHFPWQPPTTV